MKGKLSAIVFATLVVSGIAQATERNEVEPNDKVYAAQEIDVSGSVTISGVLGVVAGDMVDDLDFYRFYGQQGDVIDIDIDGGVGGLRSVDTIIAIFGPGPDFKMLRMNDDAPRPDEGSASQVDSLIEKFTLPATDYYVVGVSNFPRFFTDGGNVTHPADFRNGDYKLLISGVTPSALNINIEIKPGSGELAPVNPKSKGKIPVALLGSPTFNAMMVDKGSVTFGASGNEPSLDSCNSIQDVNGDGYLDRVCHFQNQIAAFKAGDLEGIVRGKTLDGRKFEGRGLLKVVPEKRH